nr:putative late blight resistance protein homolog R1A-10 [Ipomoea batatas]
MHRLPSPVTRLQSIIIVDESENQLNDDDETTKEWKARIKDAALKIEDEIESEIIDMYDREHPRWPFIGRLHNKFLNTLQNAMECTGEFMELRKDKQPMKDLQIKDDDSPSSSQKIEHHHHIMLPVQSFGAQW